MQDLSGSANDQTNTFQYNPAGQITQLTRSNDNYTWTGHVNVDRNYTVNGLNQLITAGGLTLNYDNSGNLKSDGNNTYNYDVENRLTGVTGSNNATLSYDPLGRLHQTIGSGITTRFGYDGADLIAEYGATGAITRRYVHGPGTDDPILWYEGSSTSDKRYLSKDERGSVTAITSGTGSLIAINSYDEFGIPAETNVGRFQYSLPEACAGHMVKRTQTWLPEAGLYYYKARIYSPTLGRFLQTDPIGYGDGLNWYNYVGSDPINKSDPTGLYGEGCFTRPGSRIWDCSARNRAENHLAQHTSGGGGGGVSSALIDLFAGYFAGQTDRDTLTSQVNDYQEGVIVVTGRRLNRVTLDTIDANTLWDHYLNGSGASVCLTRQQFTDVVGFANVVGRAVPHREDANQTVRQVSFYGTLYENSFGTASIILDRNNLIVGFHDDFDFDFRSDRSVGGQIKTLVGAIAGELQGGGTSFSIDYNNRICGR